MALLLHASRRQHSQAKSSTYMVHEPTHACARSTPTQAGNSTGLMSKLYRFCAGDHYAKISRQRHHRLSRYSSLENWAMAVTRAHTFRIDLWTSDGESIVEHVADVKDYQVALATSTPPPNAGPGTPVTLRQGARGQR
jgi:hypothetical protein